jgi:hypothetical protein
VESAGNFDVQGNTLTLGNWTPSGGQPTNGFALTFTAAQSGQPSILRFAAMRQSANWIWSHATSDTSTDQSVMLQLDSSNSLELFDPNPSTTTSPPTPTIILNPSASGTSQFSGPVQFSGTILIAPQGDLDMGAYTTGTAPGQ